ncbi:MAG: tetratricopeptide repeat protein [Bdellovibrionota bacterium]
MKKVFLFLLLAAFPLRAQASESAAALYNEGNRLWKEGNYSVAAGKYEEARLLGVRDARLEYNLGCAEARLGDVGRARLAFERAARLDPGDEDVRHNLGVLRKSVPGEQEPLEGGAFETLRSAYGRLSLGLIAAGMAAAWGLFWIAWGGLLLVRGPRMRAFLGVLRLIAGLLLAGLTGIFYSRRHHLSRPVAVVVESGGVRAGPDPMEREIHSVAAGRLVETGETAGAWVEVRVEGEFEGWLPQDQVESVGP